MHKRKYHASTGFSLIELLVVVAIMAIAVGLATGLKPGEARPKHAMDMASDMASAARAVALANGVPSRIAVCIDTSADDLYLRQLIMLNETDTDNNPATEEWALADRPRQAPMGTMFWPQFSTSSSASNTMTIDVNNSGTLYQYQFIEFDATGQAPSSSGEQWVFTRGIFSPQGTTTPIIPNDMDRDGFILRRTGVVSYFQSPNDIIAPSTTP